jgi:hypothetical protein
MKNTFSRGDLTVYRNSLCDLLVGGLAGNIIGNSANKISLENCAVESGAIRVVSSKNRNLWAGGCIGEIKQYVFFDNVRSLGGTLTVEQDDTVNSGQNSYTGGFAGYLEESTVNGSFSNTTVTVTENFNSHDESYTGGFIGYLGVGSTLAVIKNCYATGNVTVSSQAGSLYAGGLLGRTAGGGTEGVRVEQCYAAGEVSVAGRGTIRAGGLIGGSLARLQVSNCYALGNVLANRASAGSDSTMAAGLVGYSNYAENSIEHCFAGGAVIARSNASSGNGIYTAGIVGYLGECTITNSAAFGPSLTAKGPPTHRQGRISARYYDDVATLTNNYALADMRLETSSNYDDPNPASAPASSNVGANEQNGKDATVNDFRNAAFWLDSNGLSFNYAGGGMAGITNTWDFSGIAGRGYPTLAGMGGQ